MVQSGDVAPAVFLSYRHVDAPFVRGLQVELQRWLPAGSVIRDIQAFRGGDDLRETINLALERATIALVIIGPEWLAVDERTGRGRIYAGDDWVRYEVSLALALKKFVIPILINDVSMPDRRKLPRDVAGLADKVAHRVRDSDWSSDVRRLVDLLSPGHVGPSGPAAPPPSSMDAGPIASGNITITGTNVAGRDMIVDPEESTKHRRRRSSD